MTGAVVVRELAAGDDVDALGRMVVAAYVTLAGHPAEPEYEAELADVATRAKETVVGVAELDGRLVGCVTYVPDRDNAHAEHDDPDAASFRMLGIDPGAQGHGAGRALVEWCMDRARGEGKRRLTIHSGVWMTRAHGMYERLGFTRRPELDWTPVPGVTLLGFSVEVS